ncbi:hypothetical protein HDF12_000933 [Edaphobacter lichenicola]|uniref:Uncharacterized protein n=2 Tax=Tunturiibacter TaxID=3154218 RepID=A0A7Y9NJQ2_9BACT|nr:hypothetical protein [Edaphobacter lichenicola]NYF50568.1 hypothetical protein [Edaphobacter lichenicola]
MAYETNVHSNNLPITASFVRVVIPLRILKLAGGNALTVYLKPS